jgi:hypothetical protein
MKRDKYPRTPHLPWSNPTKDDITLSVPWKGDMEVVVMEKLDGECTSIYPDGYIHARSTTYSPHRSRDIIKVLASQLVASGFPYDVILLGENLYAEHSISYTNLDGYFYLFGVRDGDYFWEWEGIISLAEQCALPTPEVFYVGPWGGFRHEDIWPRKSSLGGDCEGYIIRTLDAFPVGDFHLHVRKYVRPNHVSTDEHWSRALITINGLKSVNKNDL